ALPAVTRPRATALAGVAIAAATPVMTHLPWSAGGSLLHEYVAPGVGLGYFPFFPFASYVAFGIAAGMAIKRSPEGRLERLMQWSLLAGLAIILSSQYFANMPYSIYRQSDFWIDSPALIFIRTGISLLMLAGAYVWSEHCAGPGWSWMECLGK